MTRWSGRQMLRFRAFTGNQGCPKRSAGLGGLVFALDFGDKALAHARRIYCGTLPEVSPVKSYGFTLVHRMISRCVFTKAHQKVEMSIALRCSLAEKAADFLRH